MKKSLLIKLLVMALVLVSVLTLASCFDGTPGNLDDINKDIEKRKDSEGLVFKEGKDGDGNKYYSKHQCRNRNNGCIQYLYPRDL